MTSVKKSANPEPAALASGFNTEMATPLPCHFASSTDAATPVVIAAMPPDGRLAEACRVVDVDQVVTLCDIFTPRMGS